MALFHEIVHVLLFQNLIKLIWSNKNVSNFAVFDSLNLNKLIWPCISGFSYSDHSPPFINYYLFVSNGSFLLQSIKYLFSPLWLFFFRVCFLYLCFTEPQTKIYSGFFSCFSFFHVFLFFILVLLYFYSLFTWTASKIL